MQHIDRARRQGISAVGFDIYVEAGLLLCDACRLKFPIAQGLPIMLPYTTAVHREFEIEWKNESPPNTEFYRFPSQMPVDGEEFVLRSFSTEWLGYDYDGVIWESSYEDHKTRMLREIGPAITNCRWYLEIGCGLGLATSIAQESSGCDAVGLDLSLASLKAAQHFKANPFLHFVQASAFSIPFPKAFFDVIYSRGVLHHTYSTELAFRSVAQHCRHGGAFYIWLYGPGSIRSTPLRVGLYAIEALTRPLVSLAPNAPLAKVFLGIMAWLYVGFNRLRRLANPAIQPLSFWRGVHAARDRFTPRFAHRHKSEEILSWFDRAGYSPATVLDWRDMPPSEREDFRRNVGIRGTRSR